MNKKPFVIFGLLLILLAVVIPFWAFEKDGNTANNEGIPSESTPGKQLFQTNCGNCHTLYAAGTDGDFGPNLDAKLAPAGPPADETAVKGIKTQVMAAIEEGADSPDVPGRMPAGIVTGTVADEIADFVAHYAGEG
ncbi:MAG TPA: c-type cytochrome [Solirubrobacterales bacterium]|jgi:mono/diheme cytochrome c family protein|nr:c-type cytochrome [Solirubrobacterales bacterium]HMU27185.1 c-type cytochrome [Solirubrobacterales bacterium]HMX72255.1 c-type cytochrome [Solirubrobacterales bacterium]HMY26658.1 c-type cytochrome [Solirubrobacterales bacterium]HNA24904.1 c-type cytochrome [Solirubrobacterales bacterium]